MVMTNEFWPSSKLIFPSTFLANGALLSIGILSWGFPVANTRQWGVPYCEVIYEMFHILNCGVEIKWAMIIAVIRNCLNCVYNCDDHSSLEFLIVLGFLSLFQCHNFHFLSARTSPENVTSSFRNHISIIPMHCTCRMCSNRTRWVGACSCTIFLSRRFHRLSYF